MKKIKMLTQITVTTLIIICSCSKKHSFIDLYVNKKFTVSGKSMLDLHCTPIMASKQIINEDTGVKRINYDCFPQKIGHIEPNKIIIYRKDNTDSLTFTFKKIDYYKIKVSPTDSFSLLHIKKAICNNEKYEIVMELRNPEKEDRVIIICKNKIPTIIIYYLDYYFKYLEGNKKFT